MRKYRTIPLFVMSTSAILSSIGYGSWIFGQYQEIGSEIVTTPSVAVCYIGKKKYTNLDVALKAAFENGANDKIFVIPDLGFDVNILENHTLEKGDSLIIPYAGENYFNEKGNNGAGFADNDISKRKSRVCLGKGKVLNVNGDLIIGGITGSNSNPMGQASSSYCEFKMGSSSSLVVSGNVFCYGYIKDDGDSKITMKSDSKMTTPIVFYDYSSASGMLKIKENGVFPFEQFDVPSIRSKMVFEYGSSLLGKAHLYGDKIGDINTDAPLIGKSDSFINMSEGSVVDWKFNDSSNQKTGNVLSSHTTNVNIYGGASFGNLGVTIKYFISYSINSKDYYLPIPYGYSVVIKNGANFSVPSSVKGVKFMPGSCLTCESGGEITFDSGALFYQNCKASNNTSFNYVSTKAATFINNGTANLNSGFEGKISTASNKSKDAVLNISPMFKPVTDCLEGTSKSTYTWGGGSGIIKDNDEQKDGQFVSAFVYTSPKNANYWVQTGKMANDISKVSIETDKTESDENAKGTFKLKANIEPNPNDSTNVKYSWSIKDNKNGARITTATDLQEITVETDANGSEDSDITYTIQLNVTFTKSNGEQGSVSSSIDLTAKKYCILSTSLILMADGSYKQAGLIRTGDMVMSFNHETGRLEPNVVIGNDDISKPAQVYDVVHLEFSNGMSTDFIDEHGYFDVTLNKYVYLHIDDAEEYIGHEFVSANGNLGINTVKLVSVSIVKTFTTLCSPATANSLNIIADGMLSIAGGLAGLFNIFDYDSKTLAFDKEKMQSDIKKYGLLSYKDFERFFPKEIYDLLPCKYLGVSIGKGLITWEIFESYVNKWKDQLMENVK